MKDSNLQALVHIVDLVIKVAVVPVVVMLVFHEVRISVLESKTANIPPEWLREDITEIKMTLKEMAARLRDVEKKMNNRG